ncbi:MAG: hypothetical protein QOG52_1324, partial [Frankiaceae bacterium]|nr:hypothetical protein [Frankiaceae bacterium]
MMSEDQVRTALRERLGPLLAEVQPPQALLDDLASRQRRHHRHIGIGVGASVAVAIVAAAGLSAHRPIRDNTAVVTPPPPATSQTSVPLPGPTLTNPRTVTAPNVIGFDREAAITIVEAAGLQVAVSAGPSGPVAIAQSPVGGSVVVPGSTLQLTMGSLGKPPAATMGPLLPDGSRLPVDCALPTTQDAAPSPDESFLATDGCAAGQFSLTTGQPVRYVSASGVVGLTVSPVGDVYVVPAATGCDHARAFVLSVGGGPVTTVADVGSVTTVPTLFSHSAAGTAWVEEACSDKPAAPSVVIRDGTTHVLTFDPGKGTVGVNSTALSDEGRLAVSFVRSDGTTTCPLNAGDGCLNIVAQGISIVTANNRTVPAPQIVPRPHCGFGPQAWSGASLVVVEECDSSLGP